MKAVKSIPWRHRQNNLPPVDSPQDECLSDFLGVKAGGSWRIRVGDLVYCVEDVKKVFATGKHYVVWLSVDRRVRYETSSQEDSGKAFNDFYAKFCMLQALDKQNLTKAQIRRFENISAMALATALVKNYEPAEKLIEEGRRYVENANARIARLLYVGGAVGGSMVAVMAAVLMYLFYYYQVFTTDASLQLVAHALFGGGIGSILTVTAGAVDTRPLDPIVSRVHGLFNGSLRVLYGVAGSIIAVFAMKAGLLGGKALHGEDARYLLILAAVAGAFTERFAPNVLGGKRFGMSGG